MHVGKSFEQKRHEARKRKDWYNLTALNAKFDYLATLEETEEWGWRLV